MVRVVGYRRCISTRTDEGNINWTRWIGHGKNKTGDSIFDLDNVQLLLLLMAIYTDVNRRAAIKLSQQLQGKIYKRQTAGYNEKIAKKTKKKKR